MDYLTDIKPREDAGLDDAQVAAAVNADPARYKAVASNAVLEWLGGNGRKAKLDGFVRASGEATDAQTVGLRSAIEVLLLAATNPTSYLTLDPASDQRRLVEAAALLGIIGAGDRDALVAKAMLAPPVAADDVAAAREAYQAKLARDAMQMRILHAQSAGTVAVEQGKNAAEVRDAMLAAFGEVA